MPEFSTPTTSDPLKILYLHHSGDGSTGSLCSLPLLGYDTRILDLDNGVPIIRGYLNDPRSIYTKPFPGLWDENLVKTRFSRISYQTITEGHNLLGSRAIPRGDSWSKIQNELNDWRDGPRKYGNISTWGPDTILAIDGLSRLCESAMNFILALNSRLDKGPQVGKTGTNDYSQAYKLITDFLDLLKCTEIKCNIIMICHIQFIEMDDGPQKQRRGFPQTIGPKIAPTVAQYFNHAIRATSIGTYPNVQRKIITNTDDVVGLKNTAPLRIPNELPLDTGLAEYFKALRPIPVITEEKKE